MLVLIIAILITGHFGLEWLFKKALRRRGVENLNVRSNHQILGFMSGLLYMYLTDVAIHVSIAQGYLEQINYSELGWIEYTLFGVIAMGLTSGIGLFVCSIFIDLEEDRDV